MEFGFLQGGVIVLKKRSQTLSIGMPLSSAADARLSNFKLFCFSFSCIFFLFLILLVERYIMIYWKTVAYAHICKLLAFLKLNNDI